MPAEQSFVLTTHQNALLEELSSSLAGPGLLWASGYLAGRASLRLVNTDAKALPAAVAHAVATVPTPTLTILYGSQTGNAKRLAEKLAQQADGRGIKARLVRADAYATNELAKEHLLYVIISTHSAGDEAEAPDDAKGFVEFLLSRRAPKLNDLAFAVMALGDSSYPDFCGVGRAIDKRLESLGGKRLLTLGEADVDIASVAEPWVSQALQEAARLQEVAPGTTGSQGHSAVITPLRPDQPVWTRERPFAAELLLNQRIVADKSGKDIRHLELSLADSGISYQPGDALGIWPTQAVALVQKIVSLLGLDGEQQVVQGEDSRTLTAWLTHHREVTTLTRPFLEAHAKRGEHAQLLSLLEADKRQELARLLDSVQLVDLLREYPTAWTAETLVKALRPLAPRLYSIASSQQVVGDEVHLTLGHLFYEHEGEERYGAASHYLAALEEGATVPVFIEPNERFHLPADERDLIMIGPGTGVAPFRAFLQERVARAAQGRNWLFFGNPHRRTDFLYQLEWQQALKKGQLTHLDVAFSRDQSHKVYVQHRLLERAAELWNWIEGGAHIYLCGDAKQMAGDVQQALIGIAQEQGKKSREAAADWLKQLLQEGRFARDVY